MRVVKHWSRLHREAGDVSSLGTFKIKLGRAVSNLIGVKMSLRIAGVGPLRSLLNQTIP